MSTDVLERTRKKNMGSKINLKHGHVEMAHGAGGRAMAQLIEQLFIRYFDNDYLRQRNDQACFATQSGRMVMTTDSHVISPLFFPGGNIGSLAVNGTINDLAMAGAVPLYLSVGFILEEGYPLAKLEQIVAAMATAAQQAKVIIVTGDTKVVERGKGDGVFITTTGVGSVPDGLHLSADQAQVGDKVIVSGYIGDHGTAIMSLRNNLQFYIPIASDSCALHELVALMVSAVPTIRCLRDPTRGGLSATLNEWAFQAGVGFIINENDIPIREEVASACELLGLDPLHVANEGKCVAVCPAAEVEKLLEVMKNHPLATEAAIIGEVIDDEEGFVQMNTLLGGRRIVDWLSGEQLSRIC